MFGAIFFMSAILVTATADDTTAESYSSMGTNFVNPAKGVTANFSNAISTSVQSATDAGKTQLQYGAKMISLKPVVGEQAGKILGAATPVLDASNSILQSVNSIGENLTNGGLNLLETGMNSFGSSLQTKTPSSKPFLSLFTG